MEKRTDSPEGAIWVKEDVRFKLDVWVTHLEKKWGRRVSFSEVVDYLTDMQGPPPED